MSNELNATFQTPLIRALEHALGEEKQMIGNILIDNYHLTYKHYVGAIMKGNRSRSPPAYLSEWTKVQGKLFKVVSPLPST